MRRWGVHPSDDTHLAGEDRRLANDGNPYAFNEFVDYYGTSLIYIVLAKTVVQLIKLLRLLWLRLLKYIPDFL